MGKNASLGAYGVMYVVKNKRSEVVALLLKNGVVAPNNATDIEIALLVTNLLKISKSFYNDFSALLLNNETVQGMSVNMSGAYSNVDGFSFKPKEFKPLDLGIYGNPTTPTSTTTTPKPTTNTSSSWLNQGLNLLQTGFQGYLQLDDNKTKRELANASVELSLNESKTDSLPPPPTKLSTGAIVGISLLGVTVVGLVVYLIVKKK